MAIRQQGDESSLRDVLGEFLAARANRAEFQQRMPVLRYGERAEIDPALRKLIHLRDRWRCLWCGWSPFAGGAWNPRATFLQLDHVKPWSAGGDDTSSNLRTLCDACNTDRGNSIADSNHTSVLPVTFYCEPCYCQIIYGEPAGNRPPDATGVFCDHCRKNSWTTLKWLVR